MNTNDKSDSLLTFEWDPNDEVLEIHGNRLGLKKLKETIENLLSKTSYDHVHLMNEDWRGELSDQKQCQENQLISQVKIFNWIDKV